MALDSQVFGTLAAAVITATAGLVGVALTRRTSLRHERFQEIHDEVELLAALPDDHPMRGELSDVVSVRVRGYKMLFDFYLDDEPSVRPPALMALGGLAAFFLVSAFDSQIGLSEFLRDAFSGNVDWLGWDADHKFGMLGFFIAVAGLFLYVMGGISVVQIRRDRAWRNVMRAARLDILGPEVSDAAEGGESPETDVSVSGERPVAY